ncbi:hypothetical protein SKAU_G00110350 [Synaphobranchus kaupii]|uniref:SUZ domain-containing protein 1 n=1 Tax=Synaphobranchus kaupii TaxID=118154 RepID=A0A9Q1G0K1_SYNKA|nr:hypothetical protein SKAU_G00110350 [Synaphobranchus kaupii]
MEDEEVTENWEEAADSGEIERRLEEKLRISQKEKMSSGGSGRSPLRTAIVIQDDSLPAAPPPPDPHSEAALQQRLPRVPGGPDSTPPPGQAQYGQQASASECPPAHGGVSIKQSRDPPAGRSRRYTRIPPTQIEGRPHPACRVRRLGQDANYRARSVRGESLHPPPPLAPGQHCDEDIARLGHGSL